MMAMPGVHMEPFSTRLLAPQPLEIHYMSQDHPKAHELTNHILHPSPEPIWRSPGAPECVAQVVRDGAGVTNGNHRKFAEDTLNGNDVQDRFLVVKLVYHPRAN